MVAAVPVPAAPEPMRIFHVHGETFHVLTALPDAMPPDGYLWIGSARSQFEANAPGLQDALDRWTGGALVDLHVKDLLNEQLPSTFDSTSWYDVLVFRRLAAGSPASDAGEGPVNTASVRDVLNAIDTSAVGFALFDRVLVTVHPNDCRVREFFANRLEQHAHRPDSHVGVRLPPSPADMMVRMLNHIVDNYLDLRRVLTREVGILQQELTDPRCRFDDWQTLLDARSALHRLEDACEDQRSTITEWIDALDEWPDLADKAARREHELLRVRSRDVLEHIERVIGHVRRIDSSLDAAVQMHFSAMGNRTNDIMRALTVMTAIFLPLNLITGIFGMNFEVLPLLKNPGGFWISMAGMGAIVAVLLAVFWRKRYLGQR